MWAQGEDRAAAESDGETGFSSEDEGDIQCEILEIQRDEANQRLSELEEVSNQLLKEINVLEMQFQIERSCRESAEALAVKVSKENKVLKRTSQMVMPLIPELPENLAAVTFELEADSAVNCDEVDDCGEETLLMENQALIAELQASVDGLLAEKLQLEQQVEDLTREQVQLREQVHQCVCACVCVCVCVCTWSLITDFFSQLALEVEEKEALLWKMSKQNKSMNKIKRVSQLVTEEFTEMSQKLELELGLRQHAEVFAHQMFAARGESETLPQSSETGLQLRLQQALEQISNISLALCDIQRCYQDQVCVDGIDKSQSERVYLCSSSCTLFLSSHVFQVRRSQSAVDQSAVLSELQNLREQLEGSEEEKKALETQLCGANGCVVQLQEEVKQLQETLTRPEEPEEKAAPAPPPPPPPLPPPHTAVTNSLDFLRIRRKERATKADQNKAAPLLDMQTKAVDEMMERIKRGIILRPMKRTQEDDSSRKDQRSENRKSAVVELKGMLDNMKRQQLRRAPSTRGRNVGEAELLQVLQRRRRAMGQNQDQTRDPQPGPQCVPAAGDAPWAGESGSAPVLRRLKQNREKRDSRIRASALIISQEN
ncbi:shootin-1 isoform X1 [Anarrhichthys ocellatus]|uniref:shootin-1 isoform X1 n=1 Tax=Anarrhichthys ocellatus TaxID=433405 RepID=UPI0012EE819F|nr:shootin-1-like isoform X1 [Anarrhichthys ocellatus]